jgi:tRNA (guanine-N7-)-methyltransferase
VNVQDLRAGLAEGLEVEIGCGNGHFLSEYAAGRPEVLLVGIDIKQKRCVKAREKMEKRGFRNVSIVQGAAEAFLQELSPVSVDAFHIYFPDPWPKSRHRKRRFFTMENLQVMHDRLRKGGRLYFGTDFFDYYIQAKLLVALQGDFRFTDEPPPDAVLSSLYGKKAKGSKKLIYLLCAVRCDSSDDKGEKQEEKRDVHGDVHDNEKA